MSISKEQAELTINDQQHWQVQIFNQLDTLLNEFTVPYTSEEFDDILRVLRIETNSDIIDCEHFDFIKRQVRVYIICASESDADSNVSVNAVDADSEDFG